MFGPNTLLSKVMSLFFSMDSMVGTQFESGLANLKRLAEQESACARRAAPRPVG